jgi:peptidase E
MKVILKKKKKKKFNFFILKLKDKISNNLTNEKKIINIPVASYSSSDDESFYDAVDETNLKYFNYFFNFFIFFINSF